MTRLPASERAFQRQQSVQSDFLAQAVADADTPQQSAFAEFIILLTLCGRCMSHQMQCSAERAYNTASPKAYQRHQWLHNIVSQKLQIVSSRMADDDEPLDSMLLFTDMVLQVSVLLLSKASESMRSDMCSNKDFAMDVKEQTELAAQSMSLLGQQLAQLGYFKVMHSNRESNQSTPANCA